MDFSDGLRDSAAHYTAYMVRLWQDSAHGPWRASAQSVHTGEKVLFASLAGLFCFLEAHTNIPTEREEVVSEPRLACGD